MRHTCVRATAAIVQVLRHSEEVVRRTDRAYARWAAEFRTERMVGATEAVYDGVREALPRM